MKSALLLEYEDTAREDICALLKSLGYIVALAATPQAALQALEGVRFDAIFSCTDANADDRRSFLGELARMGSGAAIVYLACPDARHAGHPHHDSALLFKPVSLKSLRRVLDFGVDGFGARPLHAGLARERRDGQRRARPRQDGSLGGRHPC